MFRAMETAARGVVLAGLAVTAGLDAAAHVLRAGVIPGDVVRRPTGNGGLCVVADVRSEYVEVVLEDSEGSRLVSCASVFFNGTRYTRRDLALDEARRKSKPRHAPAV